MEARGRGRSKGRARGGPGSGSQPRPGAPPQGGAHQGPVPGQPGPTPAQAGAWSRPPLPQQSVQQAPTAPQHWVRPQMPTPAASAGRGSRVGGGEATDHGLEQGGGHIGAGSGAPDGAAGDRGRGAGNGGVRGRGSFRNEIIFTRPQNLQSKQGSTGQPIQLLCNYFQLLQAGKWGLNQYRVDFNPEIDHTGQKKGLLRVALREVLKGYLFDGTAMYTPARINPDPFEAVVQSDSGQNIRISVRLVGDVEWGDRHYLQLFNLIIRKCLTLMKLELVGRDYFDPHSKIAITEHKLQLWPGYYTSMRQHEKNILLNCDMKFKIMRVDNVYDMLLECQSGNIRQEFQSKIIGSIVLTGYNNKTYRIDDVDFSSSPQSTFSKRDGSQISYIDYYRDKYNIRIQVPNQPMLVSRSKPREIRAGMPETVVLIPELCQLTGLTDRQRENFQLMRALADHTRVGPPQRIQKLQEFSRRMRSCPEVLEELKRWDLSIADSLLAIQGRVLPMETIIAGNNHRYAAGDKADWTRELRSSAMFHAAEMQRFAVICPVRFKSQCQEFITCLQKAARGMNWNIGNPKIFDINDDRSPSYLDCIENILKSNPTMIMCIVSNNSADRYSAIKKKCCVDRGVPTQVIVARNLSSKGVMSIATKVAIQLNCKIGGAPWAVAMPLSGLMVVGYDVCRDTANKKKSFGAMVASLDKQITRFFNHTSEHSLEEELSNNFAAFMILACQQHKEVNGKYPDKILIYRDGVGVGQLPYVIEHEVENIKKKLTQEIYKNGELKMAFVVVSKRINTKIFTKQGNPPPGTVVDDVITYPERYDFYIISQCVNQGTVAPTSYNVIYDTMGLPPDRMQMLTYKLCHMYYNWSGTVRVPAPCQYAHKLAFLTAQNLHRTANRALENILFYL